MIRRRQVPWMHRWSRWFIVAIALLGAISTGYIAFTRLFAGDAACPTEGCDRVLSSPYAFVFGLPLSLFGFLAYLAVAGFAVAPLLINPDQNKRLRSDVENWTWLFLFISTTAMMVFSGYLMYIMATEFVAVFGAQGLCIYCIASAIFATTLFVLTLLGRSWDDVGQLFFTGFIVSVVVLVGTLGLYANVNAPPGSTAGAAGQVGPPITNTSGEAEVALARHLNSVGARMFGAYWCPHCHDQKELFGQEAFSLITYVECADDGANAQPALCREANIAGYPTWEINGQLYPGTRSLEELATISNYQGPRNFSS